MYMRLHIIKHPEGERRLVLLMCEDGLYSFIEEELRGGLAETAWS